jgi:hypothetical protein
MVSFILEATNVDGCPFFFDNSLHKYSEIEDKRKLIVCFAFQGFVSKEKVKHLGQPARN